MEKHQVPYGSNWIEFELERKNVKNVNLNIKPDMRIMVSANEKVPLSFIYDFVKGKGAWITRQIGQFETVQPYMQSEREYVSGESFKYLGKQYRLKVQVTSGEESVKYFRGFIYLFVKNKDDHNRKSELMELWYLDKAKKTFGELVEKLYPLVKKYGLAEPTVEMRSMKARWGSAWIEANTISLNTELIKAPKFCIEYVILHELIHFIYNDHSEKFYNLLWTLMPDWEKRKEILDMEIVRDL
ncbi:M48 family metallopeptidase [Planococcus salinarum]|uniref:M48 family metallopeptidase n=1 Tax=Planococcus salinarum TaxID=622695 RepID=UPI000E3DF66B|nr:SprT family zinc-dependent metalloprotease [Planococcus salinarum]TAA70644.1 M48 family peptidase [Planococcus salinarum]